MTILSSQCIKKSRFHFRQKKRLFPRYRLQIREIISSFLLFEYFPNLFIGSFEVLKIKRSDLFSAKDIYEEKRNGSLDAFADPIEERS